MRVCILLMVAGLSGCSTAVTRPANVAPAFSTSVIQTSSSTAGRERANATAEPTVSVTLRAGQNWTFRRIDLWRNEETERFRQELAFLEGGRWMVRWTILNSDDPVRRGSITGELFDPTNHGFADAKLEGRHEALRFPLAPGKNWTFAYTVRSNNKTVKIAQNAVVKGWETVRVPAGSFRALRVEHDGRYNASEGGYGWSGKIREIYWYAPAAGRVVMREYRDTKGDGGTWDQWREEMIEWRL